MIIQNDMSLMDKLTILSDAAKYDAACTSSGIDKHNNGKGIGNSVSCGLCHSFAADGRCISLLKILMTNECIFDCKYCINRSSNDVVRTTFTPEEICTLTIEFYRRNYIEGLFLSSGIIQSPDHTMKLMIETAILLRTKYNFGGYIHMKGIPGASADLIETLGWYVDRMSINLELPTADSLRKLAPHKSRKNILTPMRQIQKGILSNNSPYRIGTSANCGNNSGFGSRFDSGNLSSSDFNDSRFDNNNFNSNRSHNNSFDNRDFFGKTVNDIMPSANTMSSINTITPPSGKESDFAASVADSERTAAIYSPATYRSKRFVPAGQSTQMIIGATPETDYHIVTVAEALYNNYNLKRVFYSAFINVNKDSSLPLQENGKDVPLLREHRLYQADWLLRFYGFTSEELLSEAHPNFNVLLDPKCDWALQHLELFPVEINRADYNMLLRVPGIGVKSAKRIINARRMAALNFDDLKKLGVVLKRAIYFITCGGRMMYPTKVEQDYITNALIGDDRRKIFEIEQHNSYKQLSLFDDYNFDIQTKAAL